ncbi:hypothetical protein [Actinomadura sp. 9N407]|uniref:hypothetical protein n=1 Tax=Actinomadura sp. 9N407 TaxID=3375154 RepID=UPI0037A99A69
MMFIAVTGMGLIGLLVSLVYLVEFARASRGDALFRPASTGRARRARRITGMYARGTEEMGPHETDGHGQLVDH